MTNLFTSRLFSWMATRDEQLVALNPGPVDGSILTLQSRHRSQDIGEGKTLSRIRLIEHGKAFSQWTVTDGSVLTLLRDAGMYYVSRLSRVVLDHALLRALIERWRPETQTFHFRVGEMTITLRDVALLAALRIDGEPVTCTTLRDYKELCVQLLGQAPDHIKAGCVKLKWLRVTFMHDITADARQEVVERYTRAYILYLFGSILFPDPSGNKVNLKWLLFLEDFRKCGRFAWGAAVLAHVYRELGKVSLIGHTDCCCFLALVQLWAWEYLPSIRPQIFAPIENHREGGGQSTESEGQLADEGGEPAANPVESAAEVIQLAQVPEDSPVGCRWFSMLASISKLKTSNTDVYRNQLDLMKPSSVIWNPYSSAVIEALPDICKDNKEVWMSRTPLICIETVQMHLPDRVMRQFGLLQHIPDPVESIAAVTRQGKVAENWQAHHHLYVTRWQQRQENIVTEHAELRNAPNQALEAYMKWYWRITRRWIITPSQQLDTRACQEQAPIEFALVDTIRYIHSIATEATGSEMTLETARHSLDQIAAHCSGIIHDLSLTPNGDSAPPPAPVLRSTTDIKHKTGHRRRKPINDQLQENTTSAAPLACERPIRRRRCDPNSTEVVKQAGSSSSGSDCILNQSDDTLQSSNQANLNYQVDK